MAIITKGKIRGKIGRVIYRVVGNKEVIQSFPRRPRKRSPESEQNTRFRASTAAASHFYRQIKGFASNAVEAGLYNSMTRYFMLHYAENPLGVDLKKNGNEDSNWLEMRGDDRPAVTKNGHLGDFLFSTPAMEVSLGEYSVTIPGFPAYKERQGYPHPYFHDSEAVELDFMLLHYDPLHENLQIIDYWNSGRLLRSNEMQAQVLRNALISENGDAIESGILLGCFGIRFFINENSGIYLNNDKYNPVEILGVWTK